MDGSNRMSVAGLDLDRLTEMMIEWGLGEVLMLTPAAVTAFVLSVLLQRPFRRAGLVDHPDHRKQHGRPVPLSGGVAVALAIVTLVWIFLPEGPNRRVLEAATALLVVGILDDRYDLGVSARLFWQILAGVGIVEPAGLAVFSLGALGELDLMAGPFTVLCVITFVNACNMVDGADGLLAGALVPTCIGIALVSDGTLQSAALLTGGALLGFLGTNWPARVIRKGAALRSTLPPVGRSRPVDAGSASLAVLGTGSSSSHDYPRMNQSEYDSNANTAASRSRSAKTTLVAHGRRKPE